MRREPPSWWYGKGAAAQAKARLLSPVSLLYGAAVSARFAMTTPYRSTVPVICIGGFTAGGAGKTPLAVAIAHLLRRMGARCAFLTRGYGGSIAGPHLVDPARDAASEVGDEPLLLAQVAPVVVARRRSDGARMIDAGLPGFGVVDVIIMDDGMQNPSLAKDLTIAAVDGGAGLGNGRVFPAGPLRAPLEFQLDRIDAAVIVGAGEPGEGVLRALTGKVPVLRPRVTVAGDASWIAGQPVVAFAGIGRPEKFFQTAKSLGAGLRACVPFPDHHVFTEADAVGLLAHAEASGALLVTTAKDRARLGTGQGGDALAALAGRVRTIDIALAFPAGHEARLKTLLSRVLARPERYAEWTKTRRKRRAG
jgi:tetraacyldisaccharide 4'-kinase